MSEADTSARAIEDSALAAYLETDYVGAADSYERAFSSYRAEGDVAGAVRCARMLAWIHGNVLGDWALQNGWVGRACSLLEGAEEGTPERGWLELLLAEGETDPASRQERLRRALEIGRSSGDANIEFEALGWLGLTDVFAGRLKGLTLLDEALTAVSAGEVDDLGVIEGSFCGMLWGCEIAQDVPRAEQWMRAAEEIRRRHNLTAMASFCRSHYGSILTSAGRWPEAETELLEAVRMLQGDSRMKVNALVRLADLRVRQGRFEEAAQLLEGLDTHSDALRPLAALHLARGNVELARDRVDRALGAPIEESSDAPLLSLLVDIALESGDVGDATRAAERLAVLAREQGGHYVRALAALARGRVCIASGDEGARRCLDEALIEFAQAQTPLELGRTRLELARALSADRSEVAVAEAKSALEAFEKLEAARHADAAAALLRTLGAPIRTGPKGLGALTKREAQVLELLGHGLSNPEIADRLYISRKTVEHHVGNVLSKLGLRGRAEAAAFAARAKTGS
ncbi:MAG: LuxR C-terminal-related transcriptional regulator [Actinomycetota bacterium]